MGEKQVFALLVGGNTISLVGAAAAFVTISAAAIYILGLLGLGWPIYSNLTKDASTALYALSTISKTVVAGQGMRIFMGFPLAASLALGLGVTLLFLLINSIAFWHIPLHSISISLVAGIAIALMLAVSALIFWTYYRVFRLGRSPFASSGWKARIRSLFFVACGVLPIAVIILWWRIGLFSWPPDTQWFFGVCLGVIFAIAFWLFVTHEGIRVVADVVMGPSFVQRIRAFFSPYSNEDEDSFFDFVIGFLPYIAAYFTGIIVAFPMLLDAIKIDGQSLFPQVSNWRNVLFALMILFVTALVSSVPKALSNNPPLVSVEITGEDGRMLGTLLDHSAGAWHFFDRSGTLKSIPDGRVSMVRLSSGEHTISNKANLFKAELQGANFNGASLVQANFSRASLQRANFFKANLTLANLRKANLQEADLQRAELLVASLQSANLQGANLHMAGLRFAKLRKANLQDASLPRAELWKADLRGASLQRSSSPIANLQEANLRKANLQGANLQKANLQGANLQGANLQGANLQGANLEKANVIRANLRGANLDKVAGLEQTRLEQTIRDDDTKLPKVLPALPE